MNAQWMQQIAALDPRVRWFALAAVFCFLLTESWVFLFRTDVVELGRLRATRSSLVQVSRDAAALHSELGTMTHELEALRRELYGSGPQNLTSGQQTVHLMGELDRIALGDRVTLKSVQPGRTTRVGQFEETAYDIEAGGSYADLVVWMQDVEQRLGPLAIVRFELRGSGSEAVDLSMRLASYRPIDEGGRHP